MQAFLARLRPGKAQSHDQQFWAKDSECKVCYECEREFTFFVRKHHCRMCGMIHCDRCSSNHLPASAIPNLKATTPQRCCNQCTRNYEERHGFQEGTFSNAAANRGATAGAAPVPSRPHELSKLPSRNISSSGAPQDKQHLDRARVTRRQSSRTNKCRSSSRGESSGMSISRGTSFASQSLPDGAAGNTQHALSQLSQEPVTRSRPESSSQKDPAYIWDEPQRMPQKYGVHHLSKRPAATLEVAQTASQSQNLSWFESQHLSGHPSIGGPDSEVVSFPPVGRSRGDIPPVTRDIRRGLSTVACDHLLRIIGQLLVVEEISNHDVWLPVLHRLALECSMLLSATAINKRQNIDPREYVKIKKVPDNSDPGASRVIQGLVFTKNLTHRAMRRNIENARILLLQGALEYHRQDRLLTLDTLHTQEPEYMRMSIQKACRFKPDLILVEKSVARLAQESLLQNDISLAINVKLPILERIAQCSRVQVASHLDDLSQNNIIQCRLFQVEDVPPQRVKGADGSSKYGVKQRTLMYIQGTAEGLGCTVILRGASDAELYRIKRIMRLAIYAAYCARLEVAFVADVCTALTLTVSPPRQGPAAASAEQDERIKSCPPPPLLGGRTVGTWEEWGACLGQSCRVTVSPVMSVSPYVKKWLVGESQHPERQPRQAEDYISASGPGGGHYQAFTSQPSQSDAQAMARVYYDQATQVSYSVQNNRDRITCEKPTVQKLFHYGKHDQSLVKFLRSYHPVKCNKCGAHTTVHTRQYLHGGQMLSISVWNGVRYDSHGHDATVWLWVRVRNRPDISKENCAKIKLSISAQCLSFAHFLEIMCSMSSLAIHDACLNHDVVLYFKIKNFIVCISPTRVKLNEIAIPVEPVDSKASVYGRVIQGYAHKLIVEVSGLFETFHNQLDSLRVSVAVLEPQKGKLMITGSPTRGRAKSAVLEGTTLDPFYVKLADRLLDTWCGLMKEESGQLQEAISALSAMVDNDAEVACHAALLDPRLKGAHMVSAKGIRLMSLHINLIQLHCRYNEEVDSPAMGKRSPFEDVCSPRLQLDTAACGTDHEGLITARLGNGAADQLEGGSCGEETARVLVAVVLRLRGIVDSPAEDAVGVVDVELQVLDDRDPPGGKEGPDACGSQISSGNGDVDFRQSGESNNSDTMPVVSLRVGMGPDLMLMANTPIPGEMYQGTDTEGGSQILKSDVKSQVGDTEGCRSSRTESQGTEVQSICSSAQPRDTPVADPPTGATARTLSQMSVESNSSAGTVVIHSNAQKSVIVSGDGGEPVQALPLHTASQEVEATADVEVAVTARIEGTGTAEGLVVDEAAQQDWGGDNSSSSFMGFPQTLQDAEPSSRNCTSPGWMQRMLNVVSNRSFNVRQPSMAADEVGRSMPGSPTSWAGDTDPTGSVPQHISLNSVFASGGFLDNDTDALEHYKSESATPKSTTTSTCLVDPPAPTSDAQPPESTPAITKEPVDLGARLSNEDRASLAKPQRGHMLINRMKTEDRIMEGLSGWHTHFAGNEGKTRSQIASAPESLSSLATSVASQPSTPTHGASSATTPTAAAQGPHELSEAPSFRPSGDREDTATISPGSSVQAHGPLAAHLAKAAHGDHADTNIGPSSLGKDFISGGALNNLSAPFTRPSATNSRANSFTDMSSNPTAHHSKLHSRVPSAAHSSSAVSHPPVRIRVLSPGICDLNIPVFIDEPTSVVAYFLSTADYHEQLARIRDDFLGSASPPNATEPSLPGSHLRTSSRSEAQSATPRSAVPDSFTPVVGSPTNSFFTDCGTEQGSANMDFAILDRSGEDRLSSALDSVAGSIPTFPLLSSAGDDNQIQERGRGSKLAGSAAERQDDMTLSGVQDSDGGLTVLRNPQNRQITLERSPPNPSAGPAPDMPTKFTVVAYYAAQFAELRKRIIAGGELKFLLSLSRCKPWKPRGGKTTAYFAKTEDDRYVVKSLSRTERNSFLEFAPHYFAHLTNVLENGHPTCLSKILGFFQITIRSSRSTSFKGWEGDIVVTENIFYDKHLHRAFDLKGTVRNPMPSAAPSANDSNNVLLDDHLQQLMFGRPLVAPPHERKKLMFALKSDTAFLASTSVSVMDYSLLLGIDRQNQQLVVGIIDYIRQYTWDKQVENMVKKGVPIIPGPKKEPVVTSPRQYMKRFQRAMEQYFIVTPFANKLDMDSSTA